MSQLTILFLWKKKTGVQIFSRRHPDDQIETQDALAFLEKYPLALLLYLEFLTHELNSEVGTAVTLNLTP